MIEDWHLRSLLRVYGVADISNGSSISRITLLFTSSHFYSYIQLKHRVIVYTYACIYKAYRKT